MSFLDTYDFKSPLNVFIKELNTVVIGMSPLKDAVKWRPAQIERSIDSECGYAANTLSYQHLEGHELKIITVDGPGTVSVRHPYRFELKAKKRWFNSEAGSYEEIVSNYHFEEGDSPVREEVQVAEPEKPAETWVPKSVDDPSWGDW